MRREQWSGGALTGVERLAAGLYTRYDADGAVIEQRPLTPEEAAWIADADAADARNANDVAIRDAVAAALTADRAYLALPAPTAAQTAAQVKALTRQVVSLARLTLGLLDATG